VVPVKKSAAVQYGRRHIFQSIILPDGPAASK
jgi:hypothetical protein